MNQIVEKKHAELGPSGWDRWSTCAGSVPLSAGRENRTSSYAAWGSVAHEIADTCLSDKREPHEFIGQVYTCEGHEIEVDEEMAECIGDYISVVYQFIDPSKGDILMSEQEVPIGHLTGETDAVGTSDVIGIVNGGTRMVVIDLKTGRGVEVFAEGNGQGRMYALGALERFGMLYEDIEEVEIVIVQPRIDNVTSEIIALSDLQAFADEVTLAAGRVQMARQATYENNGDAEALLENRMLNPSEKACKFCDAKAICPALHAEVMGEMKNVTASAADFDDLTIPKKAASLAPPADYDNEILAQAFRAIDLIEGWIKAVEEEMHARLLAGDKIEGFYIGVGKAGHRQWGDAEVAEAELKKRFKVDEMYDKKVISPTKAEKLMKTQPRVWAKVVEAAKIVQPEGKPKVCREGVDKNPPYQLPSPEDFPDLAGEGEAEDLLG